MTTNVCAWQERQARMHSRIHVQTAVVRKPLTFLVCTNLLLHADSNGDDQDAILVRATVSLQGHCCL